MSTAHVTDILAQIRKLTPQEREVVLDELDALQEAEYLRERAAARTHAAAHGINDQAIERAVDKLRYSR